MTKLFTILLFCFTLSIFADKEAKSIVQKYSQGVVKILLYDPKIVHKFKLDKDQGYLTRASGFFVTPEGCIFTNKHVIEWCTLGYMVCDWTDEEKKFHEMDILTYEKGLESDKKIKKIYFMGHAVPLIQVFRGVNTSDYDLYRAEVLQMGESFDGALLRVTADMEGNPVTKSFVALPLADSTKVPMGEDIVLLGYPAEYEDSDLKLDLKNTLTMSFGRHSGWDFVFDENGMIKTDAVIHEGNSGCPAFDDTECCFGIATAMGTKTQIGLIEGVNDMYYIAEAYPSILKQLVANGLAVPKRDQKKIKTLSGKPRTLPQLKLDAAMKIKKGPK